MTVSRPRRSSRGGGRWRGSGQRSACTGNKWQQQRWREDLERRHRRERVQLAKAHFEKVGEIEHRAGERYRKHLEGGKRAEKAVDEKWRHWAYYDHDRPPQEYVEAARWDQVRETGGEAEYRYGPET